MTLHEQPAAKRAQTRRSGSDAPSLLVLTSSRAGLGLPQANLPALRRLRPPIAVGRLATVLALLLPVLGLALLLVPWQQTALGTGKVIAYAPQERQQEVESPITGQVLSWAVTEGDKVEAGDLIAVLGDNDPDYMARLTDQLDQARTGLSAAREQVRTYRLKAEAETLARDLAVAEYEAKIMSERQKLVGEEAEAATSAINLDRLATLRAEGIESARTLELGELSAAKTIAAAEARKQLVSSTERARDKALQAGESKVQSVEAEYQAALAKEAEARQKVVELESKVARQARQEVRAPRAGRVLRLMGGPGGEQVKSGDALAVLVPEAEQRAVELLLDGNDMPLVAEGEEVRLLFEGWPALQFSGWPELSRGTFGGTVAFVDATDNGSGSFRVVILPEEGTRWPDGERLRQGVRAKGFVMLGRVSLGYELWRQLNGFPPLPPVKKGENVTPPNGKKPRAPSELK